MLNVKKERDISLDVIKGLLIILVVLGHSIQRNISNYEDNVIFSVIYSFHMPMFMFISGYIAIFTKKFDFNLLKKKVSTLLIPFVIWTIISAIERYLKGIDSIYGYLISLFIQPDSGLWFLWVLFLNFIVITFLVNMQQIIKNHVITVLITIVMLFIVAWVVRILGLNLLAFHFVFFYAGFLFAKYKNIFHERDKLILVTSLILSLVLVPFWHISKGPLFLSNFNLPILNIPIVRYAINILYDYLTAFSVIFFIFYLVRMISGLSENKILAYFGTKTLDIYVLHFYFLQGIGTGYTKIITTFIFATICSVLVSFLLRKSDFLSNMLFGKR